MSIVDQLQERSQAVVASAKSHELWKLLSGTSEEVKPEGVKLLLRNLLLQSTYFGPHVTEAAFTAVGRFPKDKPHFIRTFLELAVDEVTHPGLAAKDFERLGGQKAQLADHRIWVGAWVMGATCRMLAERAAPFAYLGVVALLESSTSALTEAMLPFMQQLQMEREAQFIMLHAKEDREHAELVWRLVGDVVKAYPEAETDILFGFDCLARVYPTCVWDDVVSITRSESDNK